MHHSDRLVHIRSFTPKRLPQGRLWAITGHPCHMTDHTSVSRVQRAAVCFRTTTPYGLFDDGTGFEIVEPSKVKME